MNMPAKGTLEYGAWNGLANALQVKEGERVVIITDRDTLRIANAFCSAAEALTGGPGFGMVRSFVMEEFGERPLLYLPSKIEEALASADVTLYLAGTKEGELKFRGPMIKAALANGARHGHSPGISEQIMMTGMQADITESDRISQDLYDRLQGADWVRVTSRNGTDLRIDVSPLYRWINSNWDFSQKGEWHNLPSGEVFTSPVGADGKYVVNGVLGDHFDHKYGSLEKTPVVYYVKGGRVYHIDCPGNSVLEKEIREYTFGTPNSDCLGEIGIGALPVSNLIGMMLQDEKVLGTVHIATGSNYSERTGAPDTNASTHCDGVILRPTLKTSKGEYLLIDGLYRPR